MKKFFFYFSHASDYLFSLLGIHVCRTIVSGMCMWCKRRVNQKLSTHKKCERHCKLKIFQRRQSQSTNNNKRKKKLKPGAYKVIEGRIYVLAHTRAASERKYTINACVCDVVCFALSRVGAWPRKFFTRVTIFICIVSFPVRYFFRYSPIWWCAHSEYVNIYWILSVIISSCQFIPAYIPPQIPWAACNKKRIILW